MRPRHVVLILVLAPAFWSCEIRHRNSGPKLATPPQSGKLTIDMVGAWQMSDLEYLATPTGTLPPNPSILPLNQGRGLIPPGDGALIHISTSGFDRGNGQSLRFVDLSAHRGTETYVNHVDGRTARLEYAYRAGVGPESRLVVLQILAGSFDQDTMIGYMFFAGFRLPDGTLPPEGLYSFTLRRSLIVPTAK